MKLTLLEPLNQLPELQKRVVIGVAGAIFLLLLLIFAGWMGSLLLTLVISLAMMDEYCKLVLSLPDKQEKRYLLLLTSWVVVILSAFLPKSEFEIYLFVFVLFFAYFMFTSTRYLQPEFLTHFKELQSSLFGVFYLAVLPSFLPKLHEAVHGTQWVLVFLLINWLEDSGAYFIGKRFGKNKLFPLISPKKTREGALGGLACAMVGVLIFKLLFFKEMGWTASLLIPLVVGAIAQLGDLLESYLKRAYEVKDSGSLIPGHGGFLDRFDGFIISLPFMYACVRLMS